MEDSDYQSVAVIGSSDDLLTEILIRLPVTSILRFKSVCKHWRLLLSHKHFTHRYDNNFSKSPGYFAQNIYVPFDFEDQSPSPFRNLDFYFNRSDVRIVHSCNGLLLCSAYHNCASEYYVFNPTTKQLAIIPLPVVRASETICCMALAYDQMHCVHYKVVCICDLEPGKNLCHIQVYSSDTKKWKLCVKSFSVPESIFYHPVYWNGAVYWPPYFRDRKYFYLEIDDGQLQTLPLPEELVSVSDGVFMYLGESRGHLHLILRKDQDPNIPIMNVYEMLMDRSGWFVRYQVELDPFTDYLPKYISYVIDVVRGNEEEETFLVMRIHGKMIRYNIHDKSFREFSSYKYTYEYIHRYIETLSLF